MSYIEAINQAATASTQASKPKEDKTSDIMGKQDFLTLLVAQLSNQDPLNPDDPTEFTAQLAQFSSLEQLFNLNESMDNMASSVENSQKLSALSMIGKEVAYADAKFDFDGNPVRLGYSIDGDAKDITLLLQNKGKTIATMKGQELVAGDHFMNWDGIDIDGNPAPHGEYKIVIQATAVADSIAAAPLLRSEVTGVDLEGGNGGLLYTRAGEVNVNAIKGVYDAGSALGEKTGDETVADEATADETAGDIADEIIDVVEGMSNSDTPASSS